MRNYDFIIEKLEEALATTKNKVGSWQNDVLVVLLEAVLGIYYNLKDEEIRKLKEM